MPPPLYDESGDESASANGELFVREKSASTPPRSSAKKNGKAKAPATTNDDYEEVNDETMADAEDEQNDDDDEDDEEGAEDEYVVEKICDHRFSDGVLIFEVKWLGYEKKSDRTWEPEENLTGAEEILKEYFAKCGGRDMLVSNVAPEKKGRASKRQSVASGSATPQAESTISKKRKADDKSNTVAPRKVKGDGEMTRFEASQYPSGSWEDHIQAIDALGQDSDGEIKVFLHWKDGRQTQHARAVANKRCPQKMLAYYEAHTLFTHNVNEVESSTDFKLENSERKRESTKPESTTFSRRSRKSTL